MLVAGMELICPGTQIDPLSRIESLSQVKRTSMGDNVVIKPEIILPSRMLGKVPDKKEHKQTDKPANGHVIETEKKKKKKEDEVNEHQPVEMKRSYSESSKDRRLIA